ncbi:SDR family oxidoreductase [Pseudomonas sp. 10B1]|uniref:SDR family oxidoreductase n=1 Tax=unclassified Pseudomonas TaxID=196821 RepID=UPI002AB4ACFF|nr:MULTISPECIES: SDR family oxidoreductase [unclassified Pseudomonas]MDY7561361.1 SDR family oxidoreductase [Pseudomonas sp. AB6]MEA9996766.1 SDR family oxidoreductase [Pseudomonas sp. AA4]MEB0088881.1 SDR family oxidoreductase [Pseudomonas sp. RTI1]MEB0128264.1 SDR family oxidoreductase [Pseudomonas sp. CCC1.2]MEB0155183.1 SDR family oxidoreductase [Pseudomonas sp. CCC4.3]
MQTVLITGCSSGFGLSTARYFLERNWKVIATMRTPDASVFAPSEHLRVLALDVTDPNSIQQAIEAAGPIDVLVNNAGIGFLGALEGSSMQAIRDIFETNTFGTMAVTQAVLPQFRQRKTGVVINVTSTVTVKSLPLLSVYTASKAAVNAFTESLALELEPFNIRVRLVLPGRAPDTDFGKNAQARMQGTIPEAYNDLAQQVFAEWSQSTLVTEAQDVAEAVWRAANDPTSPMRMAAGADAIVWMREQTSHA